jgi:hypothetical protein
MSVFTGSMMVLTLKVTSAAFNYQDGLIEEEGELREAQRKYRMDKLPSLIAYLGYCFNCGTHLVGPVFELGVGPRRREAAPISLWGDFCLNCERLCLHGHIHVHVCNIPP